jgi:tripartite-type tricarboxylate transporter receptor subunit TctC
MASAALGSGNHIAGEQFKMMIGVNLVHVPYRRAGPALSGIGAPKNTPVEVVDTLNREINAALGDPKMKARLAEVGATVLAGSPADFGKLIADETEKSRNVVKFSGAKAD